jgi:AcrR family transcriptional regulator
MVHDMAPRAYRMRERANGVAATRQQIVAAATRLHASRGVAATSWADIAAAAGVSQATVYRHFRDLAELVPECASYVFVDVARLPTPEELEVVFAGLKVGRERLERLVDNSVHCYARAEDWLQAMFCEAPREPAMAESVARSTASLRALVAGALGEQNELVRVLVDFPMYKQLRDAGLSPVEAAEEMKGLAEAVLRRKA